MRVMKAAVVAHLILNSVDKHFNDARYTRAAMVIVSHRRFTSPPPKCAPVRDLFRSGSRRVLPRRGAQTAPVSSMPGPPTWGEGFLPAG
jgi:hypothetical protein